MTKISKEARELLMHSLEAGEQGMSKPFHERYPLLIKYLGEEEVREWERRWMSDDDDEEE